MALSESTHGKLACLNWHTLSDERAAGVAPGVPLRRAAIILTGACNFACPYCKRLGGDLAPTLGRDAAFALLDHLAALGLRELRLSGGEPTLLSWLPEFVAHAAGLGVRVAISSNGYAEPEVYTALINAGAAEFSISLDSTNPEVAERLSGGRPHVLATVAATIRLISSRDVTVYVGMTCGKGKTAEDMKATVGFAQELGVHEIKIMSLAQEGELVDVSWVDQAMANRFPLLKWRAANYESGRDVRGLRSDDCSTCSLVLDDVTIAGASHWPCNVYLRERGAAIGAVGPEMMAERAAWAHSHDSQADPICRRYCMDILRAYNNRVAELANDSDA